MHRIDLPPIWLAAFIAVAWFQQRYFSLGLSLDSGLADLIAGLLIGGGVLLMLMAAVEFRRHRTTIIPHRAPSAMVQSGIYKRSRNPIYLGDVLVLAGVILHLDAVLSLVLVPVFAWLLEKRFIVPEENRLRRQFRADFARYAQKTRRWI
ncbi:isoprenylcysteine carboxylmethyltransferase family protein [Ruegeria pomeroyi]|uniref:Isoprenylcysteine carboxylmethyltransferase family protein n=1 Tax=Ruegeria pomeroyi TaxID=89184 RepID=A0A9Q3ZLY5_9RHOB|nr:isoprenylcysteine carboxylmethyltransferase family protein [Ruegeria pomeroyi]MCE8507482.1 isoprenylcysteine carboxylmethyltransferase family protein [Ruegeria pomeroyi]MCE8521448.1 isoprenylcysteine carboxylmethyltransferase family protein [Ruegeria pomeroyi]MCE8534068.1 isoprenylcysteine carboxylmethyltransferase family protein [Ruegeria pomeroyi]MCE8537523.1 isoprenylcysteine carboxylmethyltransferase family protein [Ruegeria pomeroyi]MCE8545558.1 isoprenylcysteine carboxylmethyltransfer